MTDIKSGDRVKVTIEGVLVETENRDAHTLGRGARCAIFSLDSPDHEVAIEKIEPPVEVFKPGSLLRKRAEHGTSYWYLAPNGYVRLVGGDYTNATEFSPYEDRDSFTSEDYERVSFDQIT